jgi:hypothetical protein
MHGSATTTPASRAEIQASSLSIRALARKHGINPKTVVKWKSRTSTDELPMGPHHSRAKVLSMEEEGTCIGFRTYTMLPLDDCLYALQLMMPHLTRSTLHRLYRRYEISRLPNFQDIDTGLPKLSGIAPIGSFYVNTADIRTGDGKATMFFAFDRISKFAFARLYDTPSERNAPAFLRALTSYVPYTIGNILTDENPLSFSSACRQQGITPQALPSDQPWRMRPIDTPKSDRSARDFHYKTHDHLQEHFFAFFDIYNFDRRLKTLRGLTPYEYVCGCWELQPKLFIRNPLENRPKLQTVKHS